MHFLAPHPVPYSCKASGRWRTRVLTTVWAWDAISKILLCSPCGFWHPWKTIPNSEAGYGVEEEEGVQGGGEEVPGLMLLLHKAAGQEGEGVDPYATCQAHLLHCQRVFYLTLKLKKDTEIFTWGIKSAFLLISVACLLTCHWTCTREKPIQQHDISVSEITSSTFCWSCYGQTQLCLLVTPLSPYPSRKRVFSCRLNCRLWYYWTTGKMPFSKLMRTDWCWKAPKGFVLTVCVDCPENVTDQSGMVCNFCFSLMQRLILLPDMGLVWFGFKITIIVLWKSMHAEFCSWIRHYQF